MEEGNIDLEEAVKLYEEAGKLSKELDETLKKAQAKVKILVGETLEDFDSEDEAKEEEK